MNQNTKEFLTKLADLMQEYSANFEIEGDCYSGGPLFVTLEVKNPQTWDEHYDQWVIDNPDKKYPFHDNSTYSYAEWVDLGSNFNADDVRGEIK